MYDNEPHLTEAGECRTANIKLKCMYNNGIDNRPKVFDIRIQNGDLKSNLKCFELDILIINRIFHLALHIS